MRPRYWLAVALVVGLAQPALAGDSTCKYIEIAASSSAKPSMDPELKPLAKKFKKAPFSAWNTFKKLSGGTAALTRNKPQAQKLAQGRSSLMLRDRTEKRIELTVTIDDADGKRVLEAKPAVRAGDWLMLGSPGASNDDGHILALTCK